MKKQELIHLHGLLSELVNHVERRGYDVELESYKEMGVTPTSIHKSKTDHKPAVFALVESIDESLGPKLTFSDEELLGGQLKSKSDDESVFSRIFLNLTKTEPQKIINHVPILISFIQNGNITTQKHAIKSVENLSRSHPQFIESFSSELMRASMYVHEVNLKDNLRSAVQRTQKQYTEDRL